MAAGKPAAKKSRGAPASPMVSKQFAELAGTPIVIHTLRRFDESKQIHSMCVAVRKQEIKTFQAALQREAFAGDVRLIEGGENRQESVANALAAVKADANDIVLVHDAVRPFLTTDLIARVIAAATKHG